MKSVLISIHPKWCEKIANGKKAHIAASNGAQLF